MADDTLFLISSFGQQHQLRYCPYSVGSLASARWRRDLVENNNNKNNVFIIIISIFVFLLVCYFQHKRKRRSTVGMEVNKRPRKTKTKACSLRSLSFCYILLCLTVVLSNNQVLSLLPSTPFSFFSLQNSNVLYVSLLQQLKHTISDRF